MQTLKKIEKTKNKPFRLTCKNGDYSSSFASKKEAYEAKNRHQEKYEDHKVIITYTVTEFENI
ncbi:MAG: hypothetical protein ACKVIG_09195 [Flavobacteriales bacterium]|jgi:hypothetical protein